MHIRHLLLFGCSVCFLSVGALGSLEQGRVAFVPPVHAAQVVSDRQLLEAKTFIQNVAVEGIEFLSDPHLEKKERIRRFENLLKNSFSMNTIARFAMGRYWRKATKAQKEEYLRLFETMTLEVYSRRFGEYEGQEMRVLDARPEGKSDAVVVSHVLSEGSPPIQVDWRVRFKGGKHKIVDVIVEGVSMALTQRSDFSSVIQRGGGKVEVLLAHLR